MSASMKLLRPEVVEEGIAFRIPLLCGRTRTALVTRARLGVGDEAQGPALLAAFASKAGALYLEAERLAPSRAGNPIHLGDAPRGCAAREPLLDTAAA